MKKVMKNIVAAAALALAAPFAHAAANGDIYEILPCDVNGTMVAEPTAPLDGGETAYFAVRLMKPQFTGNQFRLVHTGLSSEAVDWVANRPAIGIYVNGELTLAYLEKVNARTAIFTDLVFSYKVKPGDFALPIRLASKDKTMVTDSLYEPSVEYYLNFRDTSLGAAAWDIDDSTDSSAATRSANFVYGTMRYSASSPDYVARRVDYDLSLCNFNVQTVDFDSEDETSTLWRTVHEHPTDAQPVGSVPSLVVSGVPTNSVTLYVWSDNPDAVELIAGRDVQNVTTRSVHTSATATESRQVGEVKIVSGKQEYEFNLRGVAKGGEADIVLSACPDFTYDPQNTRLANYLTRKVACVEPQPASVTIKPGKTSVTATSDYTTYVTELNVSLSENPIDHDFEVEIVPAFTDTTCPNNWWDYIRLTATTDADPTLTTPAANHVLVFRAGSTTPATLDGVTLTDGKIYLYALRSDEYVTGTKKLTFAVTTDDTTAAQPSADGGIDGWNTAQSSLTINAQNPVIESMFDATDYATAIAGAERTLQIVVSDIYADMQSDAGYQVWIEKNTDTDTTFTQVDGLYKPGKGNVLYKVGTTDTLPSVIYNEPGVNKSVVYVVSPVSGNQSANHNFQVEVTTPAGYTVETTSGEYEFDEGDEVQVKITLDKQNTLGDIYAYILGDTDADAAAISCKWKAAAGGKGIKLTNYATSLSSGCKFVMLDGDASKMGSTYSYSIVFLTTDTWTDDVDKRVGAYRAKNTLVITTHNVVPSVDSVTLGLYEVSESGATVGGAERPAKFPLGIEQEFSLVVEEPGDLDKNPVSVDDRKFQMRWVFTDETGATYGPTDPSTASTTGIVEGDPDETTCKFDFPTAGRWTVTVDLRDKDMGNKWSSKFVFYVNVIDQPAITVTTTSPYNEQSSLDFGGEAAITVDLDINDCAFDMWVNLVVAPNATGGTGTFQLQEEADVVLQSDGSYNVRFPARTTTKTIYVKTMDGTADTRNSGFSISPTMVEDTTHVVPNSGGKNPGEYYLGVVQPRVLVYNDAPLLDEQFDVYPIPSTNAIPASIGAADEAITWAFDDVDLDFSRGITVEFKGGGGWGPKTYTSRDAALADGAAGFIPTFKDSGPQSVKLTIKDPDGGSATVVWEYLVEASKTMTIVAHGPAGGDVSKYDSAAGLGRGRVWAESRSAISASWFKSIINCGLATEWTVHGYGYKVGDVDDGAQLHMPDGFGGYTVGYYLDRDTPLNSRGANLGASDSAYAYSASGDRNGNPVDSFLYAWMIKSADADSGSTSFTYLNETTAPEYLLASDSGKTATLPTEQDDKGNYATTTLEAIFSIEYLASDNMGDINLDGVPDVYVNKYGFGIVDTESGSVSGSDLTKVSGFNDDEDYLPSGETSVYGTLIPGLSGTWVTTGKPFNAKLEIRGNGDALNDAADNNALTRVANVLPDRVYTDPRADSKSTLDGYDGSMPVEYLAWLDYAAANGLDPEDKGNWTKWSPERPTDPTLADTDEDGLPDGYEYYIWYRAHVGYNDGGVHKYLTGRAYDPRNPGEGRFIPAAEIAATYDPVVANAAFSVSQDTDNDGLPDLIEFMIGTNPFDFDTDGDGLPDGFEIMIAGTDPLLRYTTTGVCDAMRNYDGDAMAYTSPMYEKNYMVPSPKHVKALSKFALVDANGDTDGIQWYVMPTGDLPTNMVFAADSAGYVVMVGGVTNLTTAVPAYTERNGKVYLAGDLSPENTWTAGSFTDADGDHLVRLMPTRLVAGTVLDEAPDTAATVDFGYVSFAEEVEESMAGWLYGRDVDGLTTGNARANVGGFGFLAIGRYQNAPAGVALAYLPEEDDTIAYLHYLVYQEFGFDPRTAWNANTPLGARWGTTASSDDGESTEAKANNFSATFGYAGVAARTREYTLYDEFLVMSFFLNNGASMEVHTSPTRTWAKVWSEYTTNGRGPNEPDLTTTDNYVGRTVVAGSTIENGADTDGDGVPDGWELYVMSGPKEYKAAEEKYYFRFPGPLSDGNFSAFGPFMPYAKNASYTDNMSTSGYDTSAGDNDNLTEWQEFAGTDTVLYYADYSTTITRPEEHAKWLNKFFPTDPWNADTDGDGVRDGDEARANGERGTNKGFIYGNPADDGKLCSIPGGGLNPLSVDTDLDGIPDGWEMQYNGSSVYSGEDATYATVDGSAVGNPLEGLVDGMDGTVMDALTIVTGSVDADGRIGTAILDRVDGAKMFGKVNRDYDRDGLENWQEYMAGTMRCWRYDDILTPWVSIPDEAYWDDDGNFSPDYELINELFGDETITTDAEDGGDGEFWYKTLVDKTSPIYNPRLISGQTTGAQYFSRIDNVWDPAYVDHSAGGAWYYFKDRVGDESLRDLWAMPFAEEAEKSGTFVTRPNKYISCSPIEADSDHDGMDDYYELFHGMNPLLGASGVPLKNEGPCDIVFDAWHSDGSDTIFEAWNADDPKANAWTFRAKNGTYYKTGEAPRGTGYDFEYYPWLNGLATADPDGDDLRNQTEAIMSKMGTKTWLHTDPTPLWMTDRSYDASLTRMYFRMPGRDIFVQTAGDEFTYGGQTYSFTDYGCWAPASLLPPLPPRYVECSQDRGWFLYGKGEMNWMFSFEENEGYDSDHDAMSDAVEAEGKLRASSDPQDANSPNRRQAMYFQGAGNPSALQTPPEVAERYPVATEVWPDEMTFMKFTVEAWVKAESTDDATFVERAIWCDESKAGDEEFVRKNFQIGIKSGKWYAKYDANGTLPKSFVEVLSTADVDTGAWHHIAATFDGSRFILFVDGYEAAAPVESARQPEYGTSALVLRRTTTPADFMYAHSTGDYWYDREYALRTIVVGASLKTLAEGGAADAFNVNNAVGWNYYNNFFKGYIDEVRIWDGARAPADIRSDVTARKRYTRDAALENRNSFYSDWRKYGNRYVKDADGDEVSLVPELRYHFSFDSVPGGADEVVVAKVPTGFDYYQVAALGNPERGAAVLSRPTDWNVSWWKKILDGFGSVYSSDQWVQWVPNTIAHLPRFDGTTLDSFFWSDNTCGGTNGTYNFARTAEPASRWTQLSYNDATRKSEYCAPGMRHHLMAEFDNLVTKFENSSTTNETGTSRFDMFRFTGRNALTDGFDLLPLGGAYAKSCSTMWDGEGASTSWEITSDDANFNDLPDIWEEFAVANYSPESEPLTWDTIVYWKRDVASSVPGIKMTAGEAYRRDLAHGRVVAANDDGDLDVLDRDDLAQTADEDKSGTPDWWDDMYGVYGEGGTTDTDNDGLSNYVEYIVSECFPFGMLLNPKSPMSDTRTLDYFRKVGRLYIGEMFTDHDQMEDHWERAQNSDTIDANVWDAQRDGDEDGWSNFEESRYSGFSQATIARLISHTDGDTEVLDMPKPALKLTVRYNGVRDLTKAESEGGGNGGGSGNAEASEATPPTLHVATYTDAAMVKPDAEFTVQPGSETSGEFYMGGWEDRIIRGTLQPGNISYGDVDLWFAQLPQDNMYSWTDANGDKHISRPYSEFKAALERDPNIIQNVESFEWRHLNPAAYTTSIGVAAAGKAVTVTSGGNIAVYGERVGKINLLTGDFEFDMSAMTKLSFDGFYTGSEANTWGMKEAVFKLTYTAKVPDTQFNKVNVSLVEPTSGFVKGGKNSIFAYWDVGSDGAYTPGVDPCGVLRDVEISWRGRELEMELSDTSAIAPRLDLWTVDSCDRIARFGETSPSNKLITADVSSLPASTRVRVVRFAVDGDPVWKVNTDPEVIFDKTFSRDVRGFIHEGDFLADGALDIDWDNLERGVYNNIDVASAGDDVTNMTYAVVLGDGDIEYYSDKDNVHRVYAHPFAVTRRFELRHTAPTAVTLNGDGVCRVAQPTFRWRIDNEDAWASAYGTTYTAFRVVVRDSSNNEVYNSGYQRMPAADSSGVYSWTAPLFADAPSPSGDHLVFKNLENYTWQVYTHNAKFKTDNVGSGWNTFRLNVTTLDESSFAVDARVCYVGPAANLANRIRVQAFESPDFTGMPVAEAVATNVTAAALAADAGSVVRIAGLKAGTYYLRAYIDTDYDWQLDDWESWGYLNMRDQAAVSGSKTIFNPVAVTVGPDVAVEAMRSIYIEDRDTDGDGFPDVWEAEQNGNSFDAEAITPVVGDAELIAVNTNLTATLTQLAQGFESPLQLPIGGKYAVSLMTGIPLSQVTTASGSLFIEDKVVDDSVAITSLAIDRASGEVVLGIGAETEAGSIDPAVAALYSVASGAKVTVKVYRTETLAADWKLVAEEPVTITSDGTEIRAPLPENVDAKSGFFRVEIE